MGHSSQRIKDGRSRPKTQKWYESHRNPDYREKKKELALKNGNRPPVAWGNKINLGRKPTETTRRKMSESQKIRCKEGRHNNYAGGITKENKKIRESLEYKLWRETVFKRDDWTCQSCLKRGGGLHAHHILSFARFPEQRLSINNGMTLCEECHKKTDTYLKH